MQKTAWKNIKKCDLWIFLVITIEQKVQTELWPILFKNMILLYIKGGTDKVEHWNVASKCILMLAII